MVDRREALTALLRDLKDAAYQFTAVTPATHARILARPVPRRIGLCDVFGWNRSFNETDIPACLIEHLRAADALEEDRGALKSRVRVASLGSDLFLHGAFPTNQADAVFFGPDTYRFARFIERQLRAFRGAGWLVDMGCGSGAGAIVAARLGEFGHVTMVDTNAAALDLAAVNAKVAGVAAEARLSDEIPRGADLVIANPPYMIDEARRSYRDGGALLGGAVALDWARQAIDRLEAGGTMLLYTGAAFVDGRAPLIAALKQLCSETERKLVLEEIDPDVFGEELERSPYRDVERIAAIGAVITSFKH